MEHKHNSCGCGDTSSTFYSDENQWEPNCWECYLDSRDRSYQIISYTDAIRPSVVEEPTTFPIIIEDDLPF